VGAVVFQLPGGVAQPAVDGNQAATISGIRATNSSIWARVTPCSAPVSVNRSDKSATSRASVSEEKYCGDNSKRSVSAISTDTVMGRWSFSNWLT